MALTLPFLLALTAPPQAVPLVEVFPSNEAIPVRIELEREIELVREESWPLVDGRRVEGESRTSDDVGRTHLRLDARFTDHFGEAAAARRPRALERRFGPIRGAFTADFGHGRPERIELESPFAHRVVRFERAAPAYTARLIPRESPPDEPETQTLGVCATEANPGAPLSAAPDGVAEPPPMARLATALRADVERGWLLPPPSAGPVEVGATWAVDPARFARLIDFGGSLWLRDESLPPPTPERARERILFERRVLESIEGEIECNLAGVDRRAGLARIVFEAEVDFHAEQRAAESGADGPAHLEVDIERRIEASGVCLWDLRRSAPRSITLTSRAELTTRETYTTDLARPRGRARLTVEGSRDTLTLTFGPAAD